MKRTLLLLGILGLLVPEAWGAVDSTDQTGDLSGDTTWYDGSAPGTGDTIIIKSGHTVYVTGVNTVAFTFVRDGGVLDFDTTDTGDRLNTKCLYLGQILAAPFASASGGTVYLGGGDTLQLTNTGAAPYVGAEMVVWSGASSAFHAVGTSASSRAVILGVDSNSVLPFLVANQTAGYVRLKWAKIHRLGPSSAYPGITIGSNYREDDDQLIENCLFDSASIYLNNVDSTTIRECSLYTYHGGNVGVRFDNGDCDSIVDTWIFVNQNSQTGTHAPRGIYFDGTCRNGVVSGGGVKGSNLPAADWGPQDAIGLDDCIQCIVEDFRADSVNKGLVVNGGMTPDSLIFRRCTLTVGGHDLMVNNTSPAPVGWRVYANTFFDNYVTGYPIVTLYGHASYTPRDIDLIFAYNTVVTGASGGPPLQFVEVAATGYKHTGVKVLGNILLDSDGTNAYGIRVKTNDSIVLDANGYSSNWLTDNYKVHVDSANIYAVYVETGGGFDTTTNSTGGTNIGDSLACNFVDSANGDFRLNVGSGLLGAVQTASDSGYCDSFFTSPNYNIGAYQGAGVAAGAATSLNIGSVNLGAGSYGPPAP